MAGGGGAGNGGLWWSSGGAGADLDGHVPVGTCLTSHCFLDLDFVHVSTASWASLS